jgi:hypothetical protein
MFYLYQSRWFPELVKAEKITPGVITLTAESPGLKTISAEVESK